MVATTGTLLILVLIYAVIDGTIFKPNVSVESETDEMMVSSENHDCP